MLRRLNKGRPEGELEPFRNTGVTTFLTAIELIKKNPAKETPPFTKLTQREGMGCGVKETEGSIAVVLLNFRRSLT